MAENFKCGIDNPTNLHRRFNWGGVQALVFDIDKTILINYIALLVEFMTGLELITHYFIDNLLP